MALYLNNLHLTDAYLRYMLLYTKTPDFSATDYNNSISNNVSYKLVNALYETTTNVKLLEPVENKIYYYINSEGLYEAIRFIKKGSQFVRDIDETFVYNSSTLELYEKIIDESLSYLKINDVHVSMDDLLNKFYSLQTKDNIDVFNSVLSLNKIYILAILYLIYEGRLNSEGLKEIISANSYKNRRALLLTYLNTPDISDNINLFKPLLSRVSTISNIINSNEDTILNIEKYKTQLESTYLTKRKVELNYGAFQLGGADDSFKNVFDTSAEWNEVNDDGENKKLDDKFKSLFIDNHFFKYNLINNSSLTDAEIKAAYKKYLENKNPLIEAVDYQKFTEDSKAINELKNYFTIDDYNLFLIKKDVDVSKAYINVLYNVLNGEKNINKKCQEYFTTLFNGNEIINPAQLILNSNNKFYELSKYYSFNSVDGMTKKLFSCNSFENSTCLIPLVILNSVYFKIIFNTDFKVDENGIIENLGQSCLAGYIYKMVNYLNQWLLNKYKSLNESNLNNSQTLNRILTDLKNKFNKNNSECLKFSDNGDFYGSCLDYVMFEFAFCIIKNYINDYLISGQKTLNLKFDADELEFYNFLKIIRQYIINSEKCIGEIENNQVYQSMMSDPCNTNNGIFELLKFLERLAEYKNEFYEKAISECSYLKPENIKNMLVVFQDYKGA